MPTRRSKIYLVPLALWASVGCWGQSTQAIVSGKVFDSITGRAIAGATVTCRNIALGLVLRSPASPSGYYIFALLSPGEYELHVDAGTAYQRQELHSLDLAVAAHLEVDFRLRPIQDVWEAGRFRSLLLPNSRQELTLVGPDVDTSRSGNFDANKGQIGELGTSLSYVISEQDIDRLPLAGRDVFAQLVLAPGATADTATARGLDLSFAGQRPSSSNYLLDGLEFNNSVVTGPAARIAPEAIQEYRISTMDYTAEYGRTSGSLANAVTRSGTAALHAGAYYYFKNQDLNANGFQENTLGYSRAPLHESQPGFHVGGPVVRDELFAFSSFEYFRSRALGDPTPYVLPTASFIAGTDPTSVTGAFLRRFPAEITPQGNHGAAIATIRPTQSIDRYLGTVRLDYSGPSGRHQAFFRAVGASTSQPDLLFSPYPGFSSGYGQKDLSFAAGWTTEVRPNSINEFRAGWTVDDIRLNRPHPEVPILEVDCSQDTQAPNSCAGGLPLALPGSNAAYSYLNRSGKLELLDNLQWVLGTSVFKAGAGVLRNGIRSYIDPLQSGLYGFEGLQQLQAATPITVGIGVARDSASPVLPDTARQYRYTQSFAFFDHSVRLGSRFTLNWGLRYEFLGPPSNVGAAKDLLIGPGPGASLPARIASANFVPVSGGSQQLYDPDYRDIALRAGFAYDLGGYGHATLRGSYGIFYDRPFDNLWQTTVGNSALWNTWILGGPVNYLGNPVNVASAAGAPATQDTFDPPVVYQPGFKNGRVQNLFLGLQDTVSRALVVEANVTSSLGRQLITTDMVNRPTSLSPLVWPNPSFEYLYYRANQGKSDYFGLTTMLRYHSSRLQSQVSYTWGHVIDLQSEPLASALLNYNFLVSPPQLLSAFTREFNSQADRASADFDQRQNLVFSSMVTIPGPNSNGPIARLLKNWNLAGLGAIRSGFPYSVFATPTLQIPNQRANLVPPPGATASATLLGGVALLNADTFTDPAAGTVGDTGRNAFRGPGLFSADVSIARTFAIPGLPESWRFTLRADAFNALNHANLNNPGNQWCSDTSLCPSFGIAKYGRTEQNSGFPLLAPLSETPRQVQILLRLSF